MSGARCKVSLLSSAQSCVCYNLTSWSLRWIELVSQLDWCFKSGCSLCSACIRMAMVLKKDALGFRNLWEDLIQSWPACVRGTSDSLCVQASGLANMRWGKGLVTIGKTSALWQELVKTWWDLFRSCQSPMHLSLGLRLIIYSGPTATWICYSGKQGDPSR